MERNKDFSCIGCPDYKPECESMDLCVHIYELQFTRPDVFKRIFSRMTDEKKIFFTKQTNVNKPLNLEE